VQTRGHGRRRQLAARELGLGLDEVRGVLEREVTVADVAAAHVAALDTRIRSLRLVRAVLSVVASRNPDTEEMALMNKLARLSAAERKQMIDDFIAEVFAGLDTDPALAQKLRLTAPELPDEPTAQQVNAWVELAELVQDPGFRQRMRAMVEYHAGARAAAAPGAAAGAPSRFTEKVTGLVGPVRERGVAPDSAEAKLVLDRVLEGADAAKRSSIKARLRAGVDSQSDRYHELLAVINGDQPRPSRAADLEWLIAVIDSHP
jgi:hypothetical protein